MQSDDFEWDDDKAAINLAKHGVAFETARAALDDPSALMLPPQRQQGEDRFVTIGMAGGRLLVVCYTYRDGRTRMISARRALPRERRQYHA